MCWNDLIVMLLTITQSRKKILCINEISKLVNYVLSNNFIELYRSFFEENTRAIYTKKIPVTLLCKNIVKNAHKHKQK